MQSDVSKDMSAKFRWHQDQQVLDTFTLIDLFDENTRDQHLNRLMTEFGSPSRGHAASMTAKRIGYLAALMIYARIKHNVSIKSDQCTFFTIEEKSKKAGWLPVYSFPLETEDSSQSILDWITKELYVKTLVPIVELLAKEKGISRAVLFENIYTYIKWIFNSILCDTAVLQQLIDIPAGEYGNLRRHPISTYVCDDKDLRKTCCLYYQTQGADKPCKTCPL